MNITMITGDQATGKSYLAIRLLQNKSVVWLFADSLQSPFLFQSVDENTDAIVFDDVTPNSFNDLLPLINSNQLTIHKPYGYSKEIKRPPLVIITQNQMKYNDVRHIKNLKYISC